MTEYERDQQLRREIAEMKKQDLDPENRPKNREYAEKNIPEAEKYKTGRKMTFKEKWNNYWYHYKFWTFATVFVVIVGLIIVVQLFTRVDYDTRIVIATSDNLSEMQSSYEETFTRFGVDINENDSIDVASVYIQVSQEVLDGMYEVASYTNLSLQLSNDEVTLFLLDEGTYRFILYGDAAGTSDEEEEVMAEEYFVDLESLFPDNPNVEGHRFYIEGTKFAETLGEENIEGTYFFCIKKRVGDDDYYDATMEILTNIINGTITAE